MSEISKEFQEIFFEGKHLRKETFDESMEKTVYSFLQQPEELGEHNMEFFPDFFSSEKLNDSLKQFLSTNSFDHDGFHSQMMRKLGNYNWFFFWKTSINDGTKRFGHGPNRD